MLLHRVKIEEKFNMKPNFIILRRNSVIIILIVFIISVYSAPTKNLFATKNPMQVSSSPSESTEMLLLLQDLTPAIYSDELPVQNISNSKLHSTGLDLIVKNESVEGDGALPKKFQEPTRIDPKIKANLGTLLNISEMNEYDYSDMENNKGQDEDEYFPFAKIRRRRRRTANLPSEKYSAEEVTATPNSTEKGKTSTSISDITHKSTTTAEPTSSTPLTEATNVSTLATTTFKPTEAPATTREGTTMSYNTSNVSSPSPHSSSTTESSGTQKPIGNIPTTTTANQSTPESQSLDIATDESEPKNITKSTPQNMNITTNISNIDLPQSSNKTKPENGSAQVMLLKADDSNDKITAVSNATTATEAVPIVVYEDDPKWYGDPNKMILDDYEVFKLRGCVDFSCKDDF